MALLLTNDIIDSISAEQNLFTPKQVICTSDNYLREVIFFMRNVAREKGLELRQRISKNCKFSYKMDYMRV